MIEYTQKDMDRFERKIYEVTEGEYIGCHETTYYKNNGGYSQILANSRHVLTHRLMYQIHHPDEDIDNKLICHRCDNPGCVNPEHLFSGTNQDNVNDMVNKGRQQKGSDFKHSKLTEENVEEMMNLTLSGHFTSCKAMAKHYNVSYVNIYDIINQKLWTHVTKDFDMIKVKSLLDNNNGSKKHTALFNDNQVRDIRVRLESGESKRSIANFYGVSYNNINHIAKCKTYQDVV